MEEITTCRIWGDGYRASGYMNHDPSFVEVQDSPRAGGGYTLRGGVKPRIEGQSEEVKARLTTWIIDQQLQGVNQPEVTVDVLNLIRDRRPLRVHERAERLLQYIARSESTVAKDVVISSDDCDAACAWSESTGWNEILYFFDYLRTAGWVHVSLVTLSSWHVRATVDGHSRIAEQEVNLDSAQAFVAMWFDESMEIIYQQGIAPGIRDAGYRPRRVDDRPHINKIDDEIIVQIRRSRFLVADFTHGPRGPRGGVYYEAGFARGLGIPVIFTCQDKLEKDLHFDTRQYYHIFWQKPQDLRERLANHISAVIGDGPEVGTTSRTSPT